MPEISFFFMNLTHGKSKMFQCMDTHSEVAQLGLEGLFFFFKSMYYCMGWEREMDLG